jgi:hypothetical protein
LKFSSTYHIAPTNLYKHDPFAADGNGLRKNFYSTANGCPHGYCVVRRMDVATRNSFLLVIDHDHSEAS